MTAAARTSRMLSRRPRSLLIADDAAGNHERRRGDCARLATCEDLWVEEAIAASGHTGGQAKCPLGCRRYRAVPRAT